MARPERNDADYFPFFAKRGKTLNILQAKYGLEGIGFFTNLLRFLTLTPYHHYQIKLPLDQMNLFAEIGIADETKGLEILDLLATTGKIDYDLWHNYRVIVSESFLASLEDAYAKRNNRIITIQEIRDKYTGNPQATVLPAPETHKQEDYGHLNGGDNPQRKGKETKGKDIKEKEDFFPETSVPTFEDDDTSDTQVEKRNVYTPNDSSSRIESLRLFWNAQGLPEMRRTFITFADYERTDCMRIISVYSNSEIESAIMNYHAVIFETDKYELDVKYQYKNFPNFMAKGVEKFVDSAKPLEAYRKKGEKPPKPEKDYSKYNALMRKS